MRACLNKLNANNKTHAVAKAIYLRLIDPCERGGRRFVRGMRQNEIARRGGRAIEIFGLERREALSALFLVDVADDVGDVVVAFVLFLEEGVVVLAEGLDRAVVEIVRHILGFRRVAVGFLERNQLDVTDLLLDFRLVFGDRRELGRALTHRGGARSNTVAALGAEDGVAVQVVITGPAVRAVPFGTEFRFRHGRASFR